MLNCVSHRYVILLEIHFETAAWILIDDLISWLQTDLLYDSLARLLCSYPSISEYTYFLFYHFNIRIHKTVIHSVQSFYYHIHSFFCYLFRYTIMSFTSICKCCLNKPETPVNLSSFSATFNSCMK